MNNNEMRFDPQTGQPIQPTVEPVIQPSIQPTTQTSIQQGQNVQLPVQQAEINQQTVQNTMGQINQIQNIPTVDQTKQEFINNTQTMAEEKKEERKAGINYTFVIILFIVLLAAIYFLFPILIKYI